MKRGICTGSVHSYFLYRRADEYQFFIEMTFQWKSGIEEAERALEKFVFGGCILSCADNFLLSRIGPFWMSTAQ